jgi:GTPase SAR1 family protein
MVAITVEQKVFEKLKQAYIEKFGSSPKLLITELNRIYQDKVDLERDIISDKTIRNFFNNTEPTKMQEKNLNFLCRVLLEYESYQQALRQQAQAQTTFHQNEDWFDRYQEYLKMKCGTMKVLTMAQPVQLESVYTKVNFLEIIKGKKQKTIEELFKNISLQKVNSIIFSRIDYLVSNRNVAALDAVKRYPKLLIWGQPGAGKTTFLKHLAIHTIQELGQKIIPIFISLKTFADEEEKPHLIDAIKGELMTYASASASLVQDLLDEGRCLILLDGLDEVRDAESSRVYRNINNLVEQFSKNSLVLTCRTGASEYTFEYFTEVEMADFNEHQVMMFVKRWFTSSQEPKLADEFLEEIEKSRSIKELTTNPLLLTMLCLVFEDYYKLPKNQYSLIDDAINVLLRKWDASRRIERHWVNQFNLTHQRKVDMLSQIAYEAFNQEPQKYFWQVGELEKLISHYMENLTEISPKTLAVDSLAVLKTIEANHGLLVKQAKDLYSFSHLTFQEYFVANYVVESRNPEILKEVVQKHLTNYQWREVFLMIAGRLANADEFLKLIFSQINKLVSSKTLQDMLIWLDDVTTLHAVKSSSWRAFYLFVDQDFELYINSQTKIDSNLALKLAVMLKEFNDERETIIKRSQLSNFALNLVDIYAKVSVKGYDQEFEPQKINPLLRKELPVSLNSPQLRGGVTIDKEKGVITINKQERQVTLDKEHFPSPAVLNNNYEVSQEKTPICEEDIIACARQLEYADLADELIYLQDCFPSDDAPKWEWQEWSKNLKGLMRLYLHIGFDDVKFTQEQIKTLKNYLYANTLLIECIRGDSYSSKELRNQIVDHLLLPNQRIPKSLTLEI